MATREQPSLEALWEPVTVGPVTLSNRLATPAHETEFGTMAFENAGLGDRYVDYLAERARHGVALVMPGGATVEPQGAGRGHLPIWSRDVVPNYAKLAQAVHVHGGRVFIQLFHCGLQTYGTEDIDNRHALMAPSALPSAVYGRIGKAMEAEDIARVKVSYATAARKMADAGIDGLEISGGHGYLVHSFLSPLMNRRTDEYGGNAAGRARLLLEIVESIRAEVGRGIALGVRLSYEDHLGGAGIAPADTDTTIELLHAAGLLDYLSISGGTYPTNHMMIPPAIAERVASFAPAARRAKSLVGSEIPILVAAGIRNVADAARVLDAGDADIIGMTRALIADSEVVTKARTGRVAQIRRCTGANQGCVRRVANHMMMGCTVNPRAGREFEIPDVSAPRAATALSVLVVGGGPAGLKAAEVAAEAGHRVTLVERDDALGGQIRTVSRLPGRETWVDVIADLEASVRRLGVNVELGREFTVEDIRAVGADRVVLATGSQPEATGYAPENPTRSSIPGVQHEHVITVTQALADPAANRGRVVIADGNGDMAGVGLALLLARAGSDVELLTSQLAASTALIWTLEFPTIVPLALAAGVRISAQTMVHRIEPGFVEAGDIWGAATRRIDADCVVLNMTRASRSDLAQELAAAGIAAERIGDCVAPRDLDDAINDGFEWGRNL